MSEFWITYGEAARTAAGFFWKSGWAFVLGYTISAAIQAFVPKKRLTAHMGAADAGSVSLAILFGAISSSCSFAALSAARALVQKGAHFVAAVAFMFASTNLVIELGILILIFLGWQFLAAEVVGGIVLIAISSMLIRLTYPRRWLEAAREKVKEETDTEEEDFDWKQRIASFQGWCRVGNNFANEWGMVWQEILVGFTLAGFIAVYVPDSFWQALFLAEAAAANPDNFWIVLQNAAVAPFVAAATFIGSMGNIPLATVLNSGGVLFAGIMGFIYSDLMVPPLVKVNAKYYGWRVALYIAGIMYVSIIVTAIILHYGFLWLGMMPESSREAGDVAQFKLDYTFYMNLIAVALTAVMLWLRRRHRRMAGGDGAHDHDHDHGGSSIGVQDVVTGLFILLLLGGGAALLFSGVLA
ncbi:permease [Lentisalinibacter sediminis]|uniref:permease n=1 Tax=Lentisalinibacter sediminis TaxID=2992237 RepID=UPI00386BE900